MLLDALHPSLESPQIHRAPLVQYREPALIVSDSFPGLLSIYKWVFSNWPEKAQSKQNNWVYHAGNWLSEGRGDRQ
jgi:hypothetical protein